MTRSNTSAQPSAASNGASARPARPAVAPAAFFDLSLDLLSVTGMDGDHHLLNRSWERILGFTLDELYSMPFFELVHPDDLEEAESEFERVGAGGETIQCASRLRRRDGSYRWISWTASAHVAEEQVYIVGRDITMHRLREQGLKRSEEWFRSLVETAPNGIVIMDEEGTIVLINHATEDLFGYPQIELIGQPIEMLVPEEIRDAHVEMRDGFIRDARQRPLQVERSLTGQRRDGTRFPAVVGLSSLPGKDGVHISATIVDMTEHARTQSELMHANEALEDRIVDLQAFGQEADLIGEMGEMLQASQGSEEAHRVIESFASRLFSKGVGAVGLINQSRNLAESVVTWGDGDVGSTVFDPGDCWALRRGKPHILGDDAVRVICPHLEISDPHQSMCLPLLAQGEQLGVLTLVSLETESWIDAWPRVRRLSATFADHLALALANLRLRETLQIQSIRDPITGLFNRRYLEESLEREVARAERRGGSVGVIMLDLDHFKVFNDTFGHRAGDAALGALGVLLRSLVRREDIPCRYGGEEFAVIFPDASLDQVAIRAESIREALAAVDLRHADRELGHITLSAGVAAFPDHGGSLEDLIHAADRALYQAKNEGRNRVVVAEGPVS
ncbi:MAG: diguanylate cyclase [Acidimicrobiia bacterium]|nr:diguanylate cyclase [Acidimicrobiia bacterium]